jgi:hypothetical protein
VNKDEALVDSRDKYDEALVPYDACVSYGWNGYKGEKHLLDDTLNEWLNKIATKVGKDGCVILVADACHSGDLEREKVINNYTVDEINAMFKIIENYKDNELDEQLDEAEYAFFKFFISLKEQALKDKYFVKYPDEKEIETISDENLEEILEREVRIFASPLLSGAFLPSTLDAYLELNKIIKAHTLAKSEFLKRGFSFPNVKLQDINLEKNNQEPHPNQITDMDGVCVENNQR